MEICYTCDAKISKRKLEFPYTDSENDEVAGENWICADCATIYDVCELCDIHTSDRTEIQRPFRLPIYVCSPCRSTEYYFCEGCDGYWTELSPSSDSYCIECYECGCGECGCEDCYPDGECSCYNYGGDPDCGCSYCEDQNFSQWIHDYNFKPRPVFFHGKNKTVTVPEDLTSYLGMELEISIDDADEGAELVTLASPDLIYCKHDGSVEGFEMVTHPMTLDAARDLIPFDVLRTLRNNYKASAWYNGIHVHVSRSGFSNDTHIFRWLKLIYRNHQDVKRIARRDSHEWASFTSDERAKHKFTAERHKGKRSSRIGTERYSAINTQNVDTFEVRVFRGSLRRDEILASLELVHASVEYTRQLTTQQILNDNGWNWSTFIVWAILQGDKYENLVALNNKNKQPNEDEDTQDEYLLINNYERQLEFIGGF